MELNQISEKLLFILYESHFKRNEGVLLREMQQKEGWDETEFEKIVGLLEHDSLIEATSLGGNYEITSFGVIKVENEILEPKDLIDQNNTIRHNLLNALEKEYLDNGPRSALNYQDLGKPYDYCLFGSNIFFLRDIGYVEFTSNSSVKITYEGLEALRKAREMASRKPLVFISYETTDLDLADFLKKILLRIADNKIEVFVAKRDISSGADPRKTMLEDKLKQADAIIPICSAQSRKSPWLWWESASVWVRKGGVFPLFTNIDPGSFGGPLILVAQGKEFFSKVEFLEAIASVCDYLSISTGSHSFTEDEEDIYTALARSYSKAPQDAHVKIGYGILEQRQDFHQYSLKFEVQNKSDHSFNDVILDLVFPTKYLAKTKWDYSHLKSAEEGEYTSLTFIFRNMPEKAIKEYQHFLLPGKILKIFDAKEGGITNLIYEMDDRRYADKDKYKVTYRLYIDGNKPLVDSLDFSSLQFF
jgi:hypothetical protein